MSFEYYSMRSKIRELRDEEVGKILLKIVDEIQSIVDVLHNMGEI